MPEIIPGFDTLCGNISLPHSSQNLYEVFSPLISVLDAEGCWRCVENGRFYRNTNTPKELAFRKKECAEYYLCIEGEVFPFKCSTGLTFDIRRQICDHSVSRELSRGFGLCKLTCRFIDNFYCVSHRCLTVLMLL